MKKKKRYSITPIVNDAMLENNERYLNNLKSVIEMKSSTKNAHAPRGGDKHK